MSESEEERRLRREKKKEAARRAAEKEAKQNAAAAAAAAGATSSDARETKETEEERRIRKEKRRAQREAAKKQEGEAAAAAATATNGKGEETPSAGHHHHPHQDSPDDRRKDAPASSRAEAAAATVTPTPTTKKSSSQPIDDTAALLSAIEAENNAVVTQHTARSPAAPPGETKQTNDDGNNKNGRQRKETEEERAARKQAERDERRRQRHAAKAAAAAAEGGGEDGRNSMGNGDSSAEAGQVERKATPPSAGPSPTTAFDASELQRQAYRAQFQKDLARATALRRLVDFDSSSGVVLDLAPQTAYDLYIRDFGKSGREQVGVQAPPEEERLDAATQAERERQRTRTAQAPDDLGLCPEEEAERQFYQLRRNVLQRGVSSGRGDGTVEEGAGKTANEKESSNNDSSSKATRAVDAALLERFLTSTLPLMSAVLDENNAAATGAAAAAVAASSAASAGDGSTSSSKPKGSTAFSTYSTFCWRGTRNRPLVQVLLNPSNTRQLIALHGPRDESGPSPVLDTYMSVLLLWNMHDTTTPERVLVSFSTVTSVCVSPSSPHLIYGGTEDGNVCVWSLREPDRLHLAAGRYEKVVFHLPSYSTSWQADGHNAPVRQVRVSGYNAKTPLRKEEQHEQLVSMDERGVVCFWVVSDRESSAKGAQLIDNDYGQHPFTSVSLHLAKGTSAAAYDPHVGDGAADATAAMGYGAGVASSFDFSPLDAAQYVLTAPHGVVRRSRFGGIAVPSLYGPSQTTYCNLPGDKAKMTAATVVAVPCCVHYCVLDPRWFVVGYEDGTLRPFLHNEATPKLTVDVGYHPIIAVRCSGATPWVVWALDEGGEVHMVDLAHHNRQTPRCSHVLTQPDTGVCTCMDISAKDEKADQRMLVAGFEKGMVQLHTLNMEKLRVANAERDEKWI
ncbi:hypothetical protein ABB37_06236 [Leptomonas pyrrhocoris]|uniref:Uncharacterized protein n=1 Tax=Leptomonas pyrrhocoris TaxID=157538 RepID=A0A0M9FYS5_LEPPY|nr:hypothetical protein ABB37_06236 [Leptomonas pyrrhocoris]KPA78636.1 hypothetical protein ABB37_06236 [Leptomonas pyrrhocoris]|eukprot:XP_015657075.1 hypothetical protein ABB37_06236 [Leptomonas pyrrhocoris]